MSFFSSMTSEARVPSPVILRPFSFKRSATSLLVLSVTACGLTKTNAEFLGLPGWDKYQVAPKTPPAAAIPRPKRDIANNYSYCKRNTDPEHEYTMNVHFMKQSSFCGGLKNSLAYYDTIEPLVKNTAHEKVSKLLRDVGADPAWIDNFNQTFPPPDTGDAFVQRDAHITNSFEHLQDYLPREHPETLAALIHYYRDDYRLFNISVPNWVYDYLRT
mmetsp:Transcript_13441/g.23151  ORF Transcript_13441/g.23151 Transcript_13441/m.23151 type:complete len:216 (+) Transcript_13441:289-936(+)